MKLGMIGLGRMGANMAQRLLRGGHELFGFDPKLEARKDFEDKGPNPRIRLPRWSRNCQLHARYE